MTKNSRTTTDLLACPFCGGRADGAGMNYPHSPDHEYWRIYCKRCGATTETYSGRACRGWARRAWNKRAGGLARELTARSRLAPASWLGALTERFERRLREVMHAKPNYRERQGRANELIWAMRDIRAYAEERT